jgi:hypothetical protein
MNILQPGDKRADEYNHFANRGSKKQLPSLGTLEIWTFARFLNRSAAELHDG